MPVYVQPGRNSIVAAAFAGLRKANKAAPVDESPEVQGAPVDETRKVQRAAPKKVAAKKKPAAKKGKK